MEYEGLALSVIIIRALGLLIIFPLTFWLIGQLGLKEVSRYLITFIIGYFLIILVFSDFKPDKRQLL
jgi:hypothetical protein